MLDVLLLLGKIVLATVLVFLIGTNLVSSLLRGIFWQPVPFDTTLDSRLTETFAAQNRKMALANVVFTLLTVAAAAAYLYALYHYSNLWLAAAGVLQMLARIPDAMYQLRTGDRSLEGQPQGAIYQVAGTIPFVCIGLIGYALWLSSN